MPLFIGYSDHLAPLRNKLLHDCCMTPNVTNGHYMTKRFLNVIHYRGATIRQAKRSVQAQINHAGRRYILGFPSMREAKVWVDIKMTEIINDGTEIAGLPVEIKRDAVAGMKQLNGMATLTEAAAFYVAHNRGVSDIKLSAAIKWHVDAGEKRWASATKRERNSVLLAFLSFVGDFPLVNITRSNIKEYLAKRSDVAAKTRKGDLSNLHAFFADCFDNEHIRANPASGITVKSDGRKPDVEIFTPEQVESLLQAALKLGRESIAACMVMIAFVGVRKKESHRLEWIDVDFENRYVYVSEQNGKNPNPRHIDMTDNAYQWLKLLSKTSGPVCAEAMYKRHINEIRKEAGFSTWSNNGLRHSYGSYFLAHTKDANLTAFNMGNSVKVINAHYRKPVPGSVATAYWKIMPSLT